MQIGFDHRTKNNLWVYCYGYGYGYNHQPADCIVSRPGHWCFNHNDKVDNVTNF